MKPELTAAQLEALQTEGVIYPPSEYGEPLPITRLLLEDGARHLLLDGEIAVRCPVRVLHGMRDVDVPWALSVKLAGALEGDGCAVGVCEGWRPSAFARGGSFVVGEAVGEFLAVGEGGK